MISMNHLAHKTGTGLELKVRFLIVSRTLDSPLASCQKSREDDRPRLFLVVVSRNNVSRGARAKGEEIGDAERRGSHARFGSAVPRRRYMPAGDDSPRQTRAASFRGRRGASPSPRVTVAVYYTARARARIIVTAAAYVSRDSDETGDTVRE